MRRIAFLPCLLLLAAAPLHAQGNDMPDWFLNPPKREGWFTSASQGQSKIDALAFAVAEIAEMVMAEVEKDSTGGAPRTDAIRILTSQRLGSFHVKVLTEKFSEKAEGASAVAHTFRRAIQLTSADSSSRVQAYRASITRDGDEELQYSVSLEGELKIFLDALRGIGARITTAEHATHYYVMVSVPARALRP